MTYKVELDTYNGPMDLLLYLIRREEVDIKDLPIARIADQYIAYLDVLQGLDIELAGDFVVMAATLLELKSRALLPRPPEIEEGEDEAEDPRETLIRQLIEYRRFKEAAGLLASRASSTTIFCATSRLRPTTRNPPRTSSRASRSGTSSAPSATSSGPSATAAPARSSTTTRPRRP